ncbi:MAG: flagellar basal body-associated FliL family protein [Armatimonadota bacterium]
MKLIRDNSGGLPIRLIIIILVVSLVGAGAFLKFGKKGKSAPKPVELTEWKLDEFVVNLADADESRYLKIDVSLSVEGAPKGGGEGEKAANPEEAKVRDTVIDVLSSKKYSDLLTEKGKTVLKEELKKQLNSVLKQTKVHDVFFTSFTMQ